MNNEDRGTLSDGTQYAIDDDNIIVRNGGARAQLTWAELAELYTACIARAVRRLKEEQDKAS